MLRPGQTMLAFDTMLASAGGLGLFLVGMLTMTAALRALAGNRMHRMLSRWTTTTLSGVGTGTLCTALLQSSSATTIAAVGFVGAGLLTFEQALGIIFGANLGTTITGWLVALFGFKLDIGAVASPIILVGAILRMVARNNIGAAGQALAGFGLIFAGIETLQGALGGVGTSLLPDQIDEDSLLGRLGLVGLGVVVTLLTQSSSAGVAAALTAVHAGALPLTSAAAIVIGMDVGTTFSAFLATLGGSAMARRTGYAHVVYNVMTACVALLMLSAFLAAWQDLSAGTALASPEFSLVAFHSSFNLLGVILIVPFARPFSRLLIALVPARHALATSRIDRQVAREPALAWPVLQRALRLYASDVVLWLSRSAREGGETQHGSAEALLEGNRELRQHLLSMPTGDDVAVSVQDLHGHAVAHALHTLDHLRRLVHRYRGGPRPPPALTGSAHESLERFTQLIGELAAPGHELIAASSVQTLEAAWRALDARKHEMRSQIMGRSAKGELTLEEAEASLDTVRSVRRTTYHLWRAALHLHGLAGIDWPWRVMNPDSRLPGTLSRGP